MEVRFVKGNLLATMVGWNLPSPEVACLQSPVAGESGKSRGELLLSCPAHVTSQEHLVGQHLGRLMLVLSRVGTLGAFFLVLHLCF